MTNTTSPTVQTKVTNMTEQDQAHYAEGHEYMRSHVLAHTGSLTALRSIVEGIRERNPDRRDHWFTTGALAAINDRIKSLGL